jgi:outer membrane protein TolC
LWFEATGQDICCKRFAEAELGYAGEDLQQITNEVIKETVVRYFGVVLLKEVVKTRKDVLKGMEKHEQQAKRAIELGVIPAHELLRAQVAVAEARRALMDDQNKLDIALLALKTSIGFEKGLQVDATSELKYKVVPISVDNLNDQALTNQPIFGMIDQQKVMVDQQHALDVSEFLPQVAAWGEYGFFREEYPIIMPPAMVGVQAKINIFNGLSKVNKLKATKYLNEELMKADKYAHDQVSLWVESSYRTVLSSEQAYLESEPTVRLAKKNLEINEKRFQEGLSKSIDVIDARLLYEVVLIERHESLYEYYVALAELYLATGTPQKIAEILN